MKVIFLFIILLTPSTLSIIEAKLADGFSVDVFHYHSPLSPFYNSSMTQIEVLLNAALHSISRDNILLNLTIGRSKAESVILKNGRGGYIAKISIGTPPVDSFVNIDTGSDLIWVQCRPCSDCFPQNSPIFDPSESSTYKTLPCDSLFCSSLASTANCAQNKCSYKYEYGEGSATIGDLSADIIGFGNDTAASLECAFGCGHQNTGFFSHMEAGILGLGDSYLSFASQLGKKIGHIFSYCFVPMTSNSAGKLIFGFQSTQPRVGTVSTQVKFKPQRPFYYLTLESISVYDEKVSPTNDIDFVIDSGTTLTKLEENFYKAVETAVIKSIEKKPMIGPPKPFTLCYDDVTLDDVPDITFHFAGADLLFSGQNMFGLIQNELCWFIVPSNGESILGNFVQTNIKVEHDLLKNTVSFSPYNCALA